jgi:hypothetical protein
VDVLKLLQLRTDPVTLEILQSDDDNSSKEEEEEEEEEEEDGIGNSN